MDLWIPPSPRALVCLLLCLLSLLAPARTGHGQSGIATTTSPAVTAVAALTDPAKLATLTGTRAANDRLHKTLAWLEEARRAGIHPSKTIDEAQKLTGDTGPHGQAVKESLLRNFEFCERAAAFTPDNLARMKAGTSPLVPSGTYRGQPYEVDHIIPIAAHPQLGRELANLIYLPRTLNRRKSADIQQRTLDLAQKLTAAGILTPVDVRTLHQTRAGSPPEPEPEPEPASPGTVNLNRASAATLATLPGIGPKTAAAIIAARPLKSLDDLDKVPGIGPKTIASLRPLVTF